jgi:hypothetical protein
VIYVIAPSLGCKPEILRKEVSKLSGSLSGEHALYQAHVVGISFGLPKEYPATWLGAEDVLVAVFGEHVRRILARIAATQR